MRHTGMRQSKALDTPTSTLHTPQMLRDQFSQGELPSPSQCQRYSKEAHLYGPNYKNLGTLTCFNQSHFLLASITHTEYLLQKCHS